MAFLLMDRLGRLGIFDPYHVIYAERKFAGNHPVSRYFYIVVHIIV